MPIKHTTKRQCPECGGYFLLDYGTARCPHCGRCVKVNNSISSMRAATRSGYTFVGPPMGGRIGSVSRTLSREYKSNVIGSEIQQARKDFQEALQEKQAFWQGEILQWPKELAIPESLVGLLKGLGIDVGGENG